MSEVSYRPRKYLSISTLQEFIRCPRKYFYNKCGLVSPYGDDSAMVFGSAMHSAIPIALTTESYDLALEAFIKIWDDRDDRDNPKKNTRVAERILRHFIHTRSGGRALYSLTKLPLPEGTISRGENTSEYEVPWVMDIGLRVPLVGWFDGIAIHRDTGEHWVWELKTTSRLNASFFEAHDMYFQTMVYCFVAQTIFDLSIEGCIIEGVLTDPKKVDNLSQTIPVKDDLFDDVVKMLQFYGGMLLDMEDRAIALEADGHDPALPFLKNFTACTPYTHYYMPGFRCEYADLCRFDDWRKFTDFFSIRPEHDFLTEIRVNV